MNVCMYVRNGNCYRVIDYPPKKSSNNTTQQNMADLHQIEISSPMSASEEEEERRGKKTDDFIQSD